MARNFYTYSGIAATPVANPETVAQIVAAANTRVVLLAVEINPLGATAATAPIPFNLVVQTDAGGMSDDSAQIVADAPVASETRQTTILKRGGAEPASTAKNAGQLSIHQQGSRLWVPPNARREIIIAGGTRLGLRYASATFVSTQITLYFEE